MKAKILAVESVELHFTEGDAITKDHVANRINFVLDKTNSLVKQIYLG